MISRLAATLLVVGLMSGCEQQYTIRVWNDGNVALTDVKVWYGDRETSFGYLGPSLFASKSFMKSRPTATAEISWTAAGGEGFRVPVDISTIVPDRYADGVLTFTIHQDQTVTAGFFIDKDRAY